MRLIKILPVVAALAFSVTAAKAQLQQPAGLLQAGNSNLPQGQYMMTNINTGQSYYVFINSGGQMMAQDPRALQVNVLPLTAGTVNPAVPAQTQPRGFGGMLRQGLDSYLQNSVKPQQ